MAEPVLITIRRQAFVDYFTLTLPNGFTEELDPTETRDWFKKRNADMDVVERALDHAWNFYYSVVRIHNFREPAIRHEIAEPEI
jgi:hypothetical protein